MWCLFDKSDTEHDCPTFFRKSYLGNMSRVNLWYIITLQNSVIFVFVLFFAFLNSREKQIFKKLLNMINDVFLVHLSLNDSDHYQKIKPIPSKYEKFSSFEAIKKCTTGLERISKFAFPKYLKQWSHHEGMCSTSNQLFWKKQVSDA